jgi:hypothetical protein
MSGIRRFIAGAGTTGLFLVLVAIFVNWGIDFSSWDINSRIMFVIMMLIGSVCGGGFSYLMLEIEGMNDDEI